MIVGRICGVAGTQRSAELTVGGEDGAKYLRNHMPQLQPMRPRPKKALRMHGLPLRPLARKIDTAPLTAPNARPCV